MKLLLVTVLVLCYSTLALQAQGDKEFLLHRISITAKGQRVEKTLQQIEQLVHIKIAYSSEQVNIKRVVDIDMDQEPLEKVLRRLFPDEKVRFKTLGGRVIIYRERDKAQRDISPLQQTVRGIVRDEVTGQPLVGVSVILLGRDPLMGSSTDSYGRFRIDNVPIGRHRFKVSYLGYHSDVLSDIIVESGKEVILEVALKESYTALKQLYIIDRPDKSRPLNERAMVSARSFTVEETRRYAGSFNDPARMASSYAGVTSGKDDTENEIIIRGNSPRGLLWRLEGIEIPNPNHFATDGASNGAISMLNSNVLTDSDFLTGAFPAEYGNALSGVFDLQLRHGNNEKKEYAFKAGFLGLDASIEGPIKKKNEASTIPNASYLLNYRYSTISLLESLRLRIFDEEGSVPAFQDATFKLHLPSPHRGTFSLWGLGGTGYTETAFEQEEKGTIYNLSNDEAYYLGLMGLSHTISLSDRAFLESSLSYSSSRYTFLLEGVEDKSVFVEDHEVYTNNTTRLSSSIHKKFNARHSTKLGFVVSDIRYNLNSKGWHRDGSFSYRSDENGNTGIWQNYISHKFDIHQDLTLTGGVHYIRLHLGGQQNVEPRFGLRWQFHEEQALSLGFGLHSRREETSLYFTELELNDGSIGKANQGIGLSKARHYVIGYDRNFGSDFHLKTELYYQELYNIPVDSIGPENLFSTLNVSNAFIRRVLHNSGRGRNYGLDITFEKFFSRNYYFLLSSSLYEAKYEVNGTLYDTRYNGEYGLNLLAGREFHLGQVRDKKILSIGLEGIATGGNRAIPIDLPASIAAGRTIYDITLPFQRQLKDYHRFDLQVALKVNKKATTHEWKLDVQNVTSRANTAYETYSPSQRAIVANGLIGGVIPVLSYKVVF